MSTIRIIYLCERCLTAAESQRLCCDHQMVQCDAGTPGSERSKPLYTIDGRLRSHAPRWWLERHRAADNPAAPPSTDNRS